MKASFEADGRTIEPEEVARSARILGALTDATVDAVYVKDRAGRFLACNAAAGRALGQRPESVIGKLDSDVFPPDVWRRLRDDDLSIMASGEARTFEETTVSKGGEWTWLTTKAPFRDDSGEVAGILGISRDISVRKKQEKELAEAYAILQTVIEGSNDAIFVKDRNSRCIMANSTTARLLGKPLEEIIGHDDRSWFPPEDAHRILEDDRRIMATGETVHYEEPIGEGETRKVFVTTKGPRRDASGNVVGVFGIARDITERKRAEEQLKEAARHREEFMAMLGHELRNPLAPIRSAVHILKMVGSTESRGIQAREIIERQVTHLTRMVDDLLDVSRIAKGKIVLKTEPIDLASVIRSATEDHRGDADDRGLLLALELPVEPVWVSGDATRLAQVVGNLLTNAEKFTNPGGRISVRLRTDPVQGRAVLTIEDAGIGMPREMLARVFEPFVQAETSLARSGGGLGLGLALVKGFVQLHGGTVRAASEGLGRGAEFTVTLPLGTPPSTQAAQEPVTKPPTPLRVLIIEDNLDAARALNTILELLGYAVAAAADGVSGLRSFAEFKPDVVLCDVGLPGGMDGYAVARAIRADPGSAGVFLVAMTGYGQDEDKTRARDAGFDVHLTKPIDPDAMTSLVEKARR